MTIQALRRPQAKQLMQTHTESLRQAIDFVDRLRRSILIFLFLPNRRMDANLTKIPTPDQVKRIGKAEV
jgi:hypothetical protein